MVAFTESESATPRSRALSSRVISVPSTIHLIRCLIAVAMFLGIAANAEAARGRPFINAAKTTFVADNGRLLRGAIISTETGSSPSVSSLQAMKNYGLNAVHCYAERADYGYAAGAKAAAVDAAVQRTRDNGLYLIITIGGGGVDATFIKNFWNFYAPRYANETHVIYEIQNEPAAGSPPYSNRTALMQMERDVYAIIRANAPRHSRAAHELLEF